MSEKFITYGNGGYRLDRKTKDLRVSGSFSSLEDAVAVRDIYIDNNWRLDLSSPRLFFKNNYFYVLYKPDRQLKILIRTDDKNVAEQFMEGYRDMSYLAQEKNTSTWRIQKSIDDKMEWFGSYKTLDEAIKYRDLLRQHSWDRGYFDEIYNESETVQNKYIYKSRGKYIVSRTWDDIQRTYGSYDTIEEAREKRDELIQNNWEQPTDRFLMFLFDKWWVKKDHRKEGHSYMSFYCYAEDRALMERARDYYIEHGFPDKPLFTTDVLRYIRKNGDNYYIEKIIHDRKTTYPCGNSLTNAIALRYILERYNWNPPLKEYRHHGRLYSLDIENDKYTLSVVKDISPTKYIYKTYSGSYEIRYDGSWGIYKTVHEAKQMRDILINYNWNRELYNHIYTKKTDTYIHKTRKLYRMNNKQFSAYYENVDYARIVRDYLLKHEWKIPYRECITQTDGGYLIELEMAPYYSYTKTYSSKKVAKQQLREYILHGVDGRARMKYIRRFKDYYYIIIYDNTSKTEKRYSKGTKSLEEAVLMRDILIDNCFVVPTGDYFFDNTHHQTYNIDGKLSLYPPKQKKEKKPKQKNTKGRRKRRKSSPNMKYIRITKNNKYEIIKHVDGKLLYFGRYDTIEEARKIRNELIDNDWSLEYYHSIHVDGRFGMR